MKLLTNFFCVMTFCFSTIASAGVVVLAQKETVNSIIPGGNSTIQVLSDGRVIKVEQGVSEQPLAQLSAEALTRFKEAVVNIQIKPYILSLEEKVDMFASCSAAQTRWEIVSQTQPAIIKVRTCKEKSFSDSVRYQGIIIRTLDAFDYYFAPGLQD